MHMIEKLSINTSKNALWAAISIPLVVWLLSTGDISKYFLLKVPPGQTQYIFSKLAGLYAYFFMVVQLIIGFQGRQSRYFHFHPVIGILTTFMVVIHVFLFVVGSSIRTKHIDLEILLPTFNSGYYKFAIGYGVIAAYCLLFIVAAGFLQKKNSIFKFIHRLAPIIVLFGWLHSFSIGTETRELPIMIFYVSFSGLALYEFLKKVRDGIHASRELQ